MKILIAHNRYQQAGGEDGVVEREAEMLARRGHAVEQLVVDNDEITTLGARAQAALRAFYSHASYKRTLGLLRSFRPDIVHVHNFLPNLSPAVFFAANAAAVPVVQTLHNYRLLCANALLFRDGAPCEKCITRRSFLPGIRHACYRGNRAGSAVVGAGMTLHHALGTWRHRVDRYIALTEFAAKKFSATRLPPELFRVKPNFMPDNGTGAGGGGFALFVGRMTEDKGLQTLISADALGMLPLPVRIVGDGPFLPQVMRACERPGSRLVALGHKSSREVQDLMKHAEMLVLPSLSYEGFPLVLVEALSVSLPIIVSRIGGLPELVEDGVSAILYTPGEASELLAAMRYLAAQPLKAAAMRLAARSLYLERYTEAANYDALVSIYGELLVNHTATAPGAYSAVRTA